METNTKSIARFFFSFLAVIIVSVITQQGLHHSVEADGSLTLWIFDIGQGDAIFIDGPEKQVLIDGGPNADILEKLGQVMPFWDQEIDIMINTHPHADHVTGLVKVLEHYEVGEVYDSGQDYGSAIFSTFEEMGHPEPLQQGVEFDLGGGAFLHVVYPFSTEGDFDDVNEGSVVTYLSYGGTTALLTGDISVVQEQALTGLIPHVDVLKVAHQGSRTSSNMSFLESITPDFAVIPVGENSYGHPHAEVVQRLKTVGAEVLRTDEEGDIRVSSSGGEPEVTGLEL